MLSLFFEMITIAHEMKGKKDTTKHGVYTENTVDVKENKPIMTAVASGTDVKILENYWK